MPVSSTAAHRLVDATVTLVDEGGLAVSEQPVVVSQRRHAFTFGCTGFEAIPLANDELTGDAQDGVAALYDRWLELFNTATLPFYWGRFEPERGRPTPAAPRRGPLVHRRGVRRQGPSAVLAHGDGAVAVRADRTTRSRRPRSPGSSARSRTSRPDRHVGRDQRGRDHAGVRPVRERHHPSRPRARPRRDRPAGVRRGARGQPAATLLINDFDLSADYERLIEDCLEAGITIDAIGMQSHMHQGYWGEERTLELLERFARFGLPLHWTETTLVSGELMPPEIVDLNDYQVDDWPTTPEGEARQADEVERHYRTLVGHPAVAAITWWGLPRRRLAQRTERSRPGRRLAQARVRRAPRA